MYIELYFREALIAENIFDLTVKKVQKLERRFFVYIEKGVETGPREYITPQIFSRGFVNSFELISSDLILKWQSNRSQMLIDQLAFVLLSDEQWTFV